MDANLSKLLEENARMVDAALEDFIRSDPDTVPNLQDGLLYALGLDLDDPKARGKRIRPSLCLIACETLGGSAQRALPFAMAIELMHNFFLVHDDIQDGDTTRRGRAAVWKQYGLAHGINIGDYLYTKVFAAMLTAETEETNTLLEVALWKLLVQTLEKTHVGQAQDMNALKTRVFTVENYMEIVTNKTGYYLAAPLVGGAMIAGADPETIEALSRLGHCLGPVFQIVDDIIDLTEGKGRETIGSDIREGKRSYLVAHAASHANAEEREELFRVLDLPRNETTEAHILWARDLFLQYDAIQAGRDHCESMMDEALGLLKPTPRALRETLTPIFEAMLKRRA